jgi:plastocyanin
LNRRNVEAPARRIARAGALFFLLLSACDREGGADAGPRVLELTHDTIQLPDSVKLIDVKVRREASGDFEPASLQARQNDMVRFTAADRAGHAIAFDGATLAADARAYLERTGQLRGPPLITTDAAWVITLDGAPAGQYPFRCVTHDLAGTLTVTPRS